jgi:ATP-dependent helicase/nuclease subunit B
MLSIVTGPFHPDLESALVSQVRSLKQDDPLAPVAIIVPSQQLARRVMWLLAVEQGLALLDVHVLTFHQLAETLIEEGGADQPARADEILREEMLRALVARGVPGSEAFRDWAKMRGLWRGLWETIKDLKEARVDPGSVLAAVKEKMLGSEDPERLDSLFRLYAAALAADRELRLADPDDLAALAVELVPASTLLSRMRRVCYYGFYDLTQGQLDLFKAVTSACPTSVFFPLRRDIPAYRFAQRFFEAYIQGMTIRVGGGPADAPPTPTRTSSSLADEIAPAVRGTCRIISAVGPKDEVSATAKEILRLIEDQGYDPLEVGVVVRTLDPCLPVVRRVFEENNVPFACPVGEPLIHQPLAKTIIRFFRLRVESFSRTSVLDVLTSPAFRLAEFCEAGKAPRPDQWEWITRGLGITRGNPADGSLGEWRRLERAIQPGFGGPDNHETDKGLDRGVIAAQMGLLWALVKRLHADLSAIPSCAGWGEYAEAFARLLPTYFDLPAWNGAPPADHDGRVQTAIRDCLVSIGRLEALDEEVSLSDWTDLMVRALERARLPSETRHQTGVQVLDAMDARGVPFRALFVLGLNEKVFPRSIREDALLRDADREVLARDLGFKIALKLDGFEEERLLFALLLRSAKERLYLSYQRADRAGRTLVPSGYLVELQREMGHTGAGERERKIKRRPSERWAEWPYELLLLTAREMGLRVILRGGSVRSEWRTLYSEPDLLEQGVSALKELESAKAGLTPFDGLVGPVASHWDALERRGAAPTSLERYAQCPFRYFAAQVLRLQPMEAPESVVELDARSRGALCHALLRAFYERLKRDGVSVAEVLTDDAVRLLADVAPPVFAEYEENNWVGYPLLWALAKEEALWLVEQLIREDLRELRQSGYVPTLFEVEGRGRFDSNLPPPLQAIPVRGILDRVDVRKDSGRTVVRVVDYKYTQAGAPKDRDLATAAVRGMRLQPPLYLLAAREVLGEPAVPESAAFYFLAPNRKDGPLGRSFLDASCWVGETGVLIGRTLTLILEGIRAGRFFILPGGYCDHCDYSEVCRRHHNQSWWRARGDESRKELENLHRLKAPKAETKTAEAEAKAGKKPGRKRGG